MTQDCDLQLLAARGANLCGEDKFDVVCCNNCQGQYLYNLELKDVYYDPADLKRRFFKIPGMQLPPCRYCGAVNWQFSEQGPDEVAILSGCWAWAL